MPVIPKIEQPEDEDLRHLYERLSQNPMGNLNIFKVMAHSPKLMRDWLRMATPLLGNGLLLSARLREITILRVAQNARSEYEFGQHIPIARAAGLTDEEIGALKDYEDSDQFSDLERAVIRYVDAVSPFAADAPDRARALRQWLSDRELLELSFVIGHWTMVACVLVPLEVELDEHVEARLPEGWREWL
jgi:4-carboxymuconolactone decarboxylase